MSTGKPSQAVDKVLEMIQTVYEELMKKRIELLEAKLKNSPDVSDRELVISYLQADFDGMLKTYNGYTNVMRKSGKESNYSEDLLTKMQQIKANVGSIVSRIPSNTQNNDSV